MRIVLTFRKRKKIDERWAVADEVEAVERIIHSSDSKPQYIYKHSTRCMLSTWAYSEVEEATGELYPNVEINYVDVLAGREVSNLIADQFDIRHESPQILLVWHGEVLWSASHRSVKKGEIIERAQNLLKSIS